MDEASSKEGQVVSKFHQKRYGSIHPIEDVPREVNIHCVSDPGFTRKYGAAVKAVGGHYTACRGYQHTRFVHVPCKGNEALIGAIVRDYGMMRKGVVTMVVHTRGLCAAQAWMIVHGVAKEGEGEIFERFVAQYHGALQSAVERGHISGIYAGPVPALHTTTEQTKSRFNEACQRLPLVEAALVEAALAFGRADIGMAEMTVAISECANARTERDEADKALKEAEEGLKALYAAPEEAA